MVSQSLSSYLGVKMWILLLVVCSPLALGQQVNVDGLLTTTGEETIVYEQETLPKATSWTPEEPGFTFATDTSYYAVSKLQSWLTQRDA